MNDVVLVDEFDAKGNSWNGVLETPLAMTIIAMWFISIVELPVSTLVHGSPFNRAILKPSMAL
jgi:hypothetical protein